MNDKLTLDADLAPLAGARAAQWTKRDAAHLLRRAGFAATADEIEQTHRAGLQAAVERLIAEQPESAEFTAANHVLRKAADASANIGDLKAWWLYRMLHSANPLREKLCLLWHNHFATSNAKVKSVRAMADQNDLIRKHALGDFTKLLHGMTRDVAMLEWLDGNENKKRAPNENFARELMELFSLGVGNYTEKDIKEAARAFTGWHVRGPEFFFDRVHHDYGNKRVFGAAGDFDGGQVVDLCLRQPASARFLALKLLRTFVVDQPEPKLIDLLAERIRQHKYIMAPVLRELLASKLFFSPGARHAIIKGPIELVLGTYRALNVRPHFGPTIRFLADLGQDVFEPPTVKGWEGGRLWVSSASLLLRANFVAQLLSSAAFGELADPVQALSKRGLSEPKSIVEHYLELLVGRDLDPSARDRLVAYAKQNANDQNQMVRGALHLILTLPEYQLM